MNKFMGMAIIVTIGLATGMAFSQTVPRGGGGGGGPCYKTTIGQECGLPIVYSQENCGQIVCITSEVKFDKLMSCDSADTGLTGCSAVNCNKHIITRVCAGPLACNLVSDAETPEMSGTKATGNVCPVGSGPG